MAACPVEVVANAGPVCQQMLNRHVLADERQICAQHRPGSRGQAQRTLADQADHRQRRQPFGPAGDPEPGADRARQLVRAVSQPVCHRELGLTVTIDHHHASESALLGE